MPMFEFGRNGGQGRFFSLKHHAAGFPVFVLIVGMEKTAVQNQKKERCYKKDNAQ